MHMLRYINIICYRMMAMILLYTVLEYFEISIISLP